MGAEDPDDPDDLYGLALEEFVAARDALAKRLRAAGDRAAADAVKRLPKPSAAAWAVNQAVRSQPRAARELWTAGDELAATQERLLAGDADRDALRAATTAEREALAPLLDAARGLLTGSGAGVSETALARVEESLHAAALDPDVRPDVAAGRLTKELRHVGMGTLAGPVSGGEGRAKRAAGGAAAKPARGGARAAAKERGGAAGIPDREAAKREEAARKRLEAARARVEAARREVDAAREAFAAARDDARAARKQAGVAERAAQQARRRAERSAAAADAAGEREEAARAALDEAQAAVRDARGR